MDPLHRCQGARSALGQRTGRLAPCLAHRPFNRPDTPGYEFSADVISVEGMDVEGGWLYFLASPDDPVRQYLYRSRLDGQGTPERVTPQGARGWNTYDVAPNGRLASHTFSTFTCPPHIEIVSLPDHKPLRTLEDNHDLANKAKAIFTSEPEFFKVTVPNNIALDGWILKPPDFDPGKKYPVLTYVYGE